jgi:ATP-dependent DNA helicase RecG
MMSDELMALLGDCRKAIGAERQHRYVNVQGRKQRFDQFVGQTLRRLMAALGRDDPNFNTLQEVHARAARYGQMAMADRLDAVQRLEAMLHEVEASFQQPVNPSVKAATTVDKPKAPQSMAMGESISKTITLAPPDAVPPLDQPIQFIKRVGPKMAELLAKLGILTVRNLLFYFPRRYVDYQNRSPIGQLTEGDDVTVMGTVVQVQTSMLRGRNMTIVSLHVRDDSGVVLISRFFGKSNRAYLESYKAQYPKGTDVMVSGRVKWDRYKQLPTLDNAQIEILGYADAEADSPGGASLHVGKVVPIYPLTEGLSLRFLRQLLHRVLHEHLPLIEDPVPAFALEQYDLLPLPQALVQIHFPESAAIFATARRRLVFDELFWLQVRLAKARKAFRENLEGSPSAQLVRHEAGYVAQFLQQLPFTLTAAQSKVFDEIQTDLNRPEPMYRLLQGDVGSGKTVVAVLTLLLGLENNTQGAMMVPTEILAEQHYKKLVSWLTPLGLRVGLFTGTQRAKAKRELRQDLANGLIHLAVGTHALIQDGITFSNLGVVVVDEQHRFGVRQRLLLKEKGHMPHLLTMTATPIPRTLAMTLHGDLDVSTMDERPPGRTPIVTQLCFSQQRRHIETVIRQHLLEGRQAYIVFPLVDESETLAVKAATAEVERLKTEVFGEQRIGLLHGKMHPRGQRRCHECLCQGRHPDFGVYHRGRGWR